MFADVGTVGKSYDLETVVEVARLLEAEGSANIRFVLAGEGEKFQALQERAKDLRNIEFAGWLTADEIRSLLSVSYAGLVPCISAPDTMPNKPFEYLSAGLPLVSSLEGEMVGLIEREALGVNYHYGDVAGLKNCIKMLCADSVRDTFSFNARNVFQAQFDARLIYHRYADCLERLAVGCR